MHQGTKIPGLSESSSAEPIHSMHDVADNTGNNPRTLDVRNTFYGIICSVKRAVSSSFSMPRLKNVSAEDLKI